jgi:hypothetical protein
MLGAAALALVTAAEPSLPESLSGIVRPALKAFLGVAGMNRKSWTALMSWFSETRSAPAAGSNRPLRS